MKINPAGEDSSSRMSLCSETAVQNSRLSKDVKITGSLSFIVYLFVWAPHCAAAISGAAHRSAGLRPWVKDLFFSVEAQASC